MGRAVTDGASGPYTVQDLRAFQRGTAAVVMPVAAGWKIAYLSGMDFEQQRGTTFGTIEEALAAVEELLPRELAGRAGKATQHGAAARGTREQ